MPNEGDRVAALWAEYEPRIKAAEETGSKEFDVSFSDLVEERILDFPAVSLTIERYLILKNAGVFDGTSGSSVNPILVFLWIVSPDFVPEPRASKKFYRKHRNLDLEEYAVAVEDYVSRIFRHAPDSGGGDDGEAVNNSEEWIPVVIDVIASEYGWKEDEILRIPLPRLFKYSTRIAIRHGGDATPFNAEADRLRQEFMDKANEKLEETS